MRGLRSGRATLLVAALASVSMISAFPATAAAGGTTRWVDDDGFAGPSSCDGSAVAATHVQDAVDASSNNDTVKVCPGKYVEQVEIQGKDGLHLIGTTPWAATIKAPGDLTTSTADFYPEVIGVSSNDVLVQWLRVIANTDTCQPGPIGGHFNGILVSNATGVEIRSNRIVGTHPNGQACGMADGIIFDGDTTGRAAYNLIRGFNQTGIYVSGGALATLHRNSIRVFEEFCAASTSSLTSQCTAGGPTSQGIRVSASSAKVRKNVVTVDTNTVGAGTTAGIEIDGVHSASSHWVRVSRNTVTGLGDGIEVSDSDGVVVRRNAVSDGTRNGISLFASVTGSSVTKNSVHGQVGFGMHAYDGTSGNTISNNDFSGNGQADCVDDSGSTTAPRPAAVLNSWTNDFGDESNPGGLCTPAP